MLIVDDDRALAGLLRRSLAAQCERIETTHTAAEALRAFAVAEPHLVVLDLDLGEAREAALHGREGRQGLSVLERVRAASPRCPVLVLSAAADTETRVRCLELGADDCLQKPFSLAELRARCGGLLRRRLLDEAAGAAEPVVLETAGLSLDRLRRSVTMSGAPVALTGREFTLLEQLLLHAGSVVTRASLREAFGFGWEGETNTVDVHMAALRRKLKAWPGAPEIETVRGLGYRLAVGGGGL